MLSRIRIHWGLLVWICFALMCEWIPMVSFMSWTCLSKSLGTGHLEIKKVTNFGVWPVQWDLSTLNLYKNIKYRSTLWRKKFSRSTETVVNYCWMRMECHRGARQFHITTVCRTGLCYQNKAYKLQFNVPWNWHTSTLQMHTDAAVAADDNQDIGNPFLNIRRLVFLFEWMGFLCSTNIHKPVLGEHAILLLAGIFGCGCGIWKYYTDHFRVNKGAW